MDTAPETWRWIWLAAGVALIVGEMSVPGTFILIPFGISAIVAMLLAFAGVDLIIQWLVFVVLGAGLFTWFWKLSRRSIGGMGAPEGAGESRLLGMEGVVTEQIPGPPEGAGAVRLGGERWRAVTEDGPIEEGARVTVISVRGTRVVVAEVARPTTESKQTNG